MKNFLKDILKSNKTLFVSVYVLSLVLFSAGPAFASTPYLSLSNTGNNMVQLTVSNADANSAVNFYNNSGNFLANLGTTNSSGYFSTTINQNTYSIPQNSYVFVTVNGQNSSSVQWPYSSGNNYGNVYLSQNSVTLGYNQSANINVYGGSGTYYISSNTNSGIVSVALNSNNVLGVTSNSNTGTVAVTVCSYNNSGCATLYVYVNSNSYNQPTYFSQSSLNLNVGQGQAVTIYGSGSYSISSNSNPTAISALISGSTLNVYGSAQGSGTLNICSGNGGGCANLYVTVNGYSYNYNNYYGYNGYNGYYNNGYYNSYYNGYTYNPGNNYGTTGYTTTYYYPQTQGRVLGASTDSSVYLNQLPATGVSLNLKTILFTIGLLVWSLFAAYIFTAKRRQKAQNRF